MSKSNQYEEPTGYRIDEFERLNAILYGPEGLFTPKAEGAV